MMSPWLSDIAPEPHRAQVGAFVVDLERTADFMLAVVDALAPAGTVTMARDEYRELALRIAAAARLGRAHHATLSAREQAR